MGRWLATGAATLALSAALASAQPAVADRSLVVGFSDDALKFEPALARAAARDLGVGVYRITVHWPAGATAIDGAEQTALARAVRDLGGIRIVVSVFGPADAAPQTDADRDAYCAFVASILHRFPAIHDVVIWNEVNKTRFWKPQFSESGESAAPAAYAALLARCWDVLHAAIPAVNLVGFATSPTGNDRPDAVSNVSHSPGAFIRAVGRAYAASGRATRIFDTVDHHAYPMHSAERPWKAHLGSTIGQGDWQKLMQALYDGFRGTRQPIPGQEGVSIWYLEDGFETVPDPEKAHVYWGVEDAAHVLPDVATDEVRAAASPGGLAPDQATQIADAVRLAYCQAYVGAFLSFQLWDEAGLGAWQSAPYWRDRTPKGSWDAFRAVFAEVNERRVDCGALPGGRPPEMFVPAPESLSAPSIRGTALPGQVLRASAGSWSGAESFAFRWHRCGAQGVCRAILGATAVRYRVRPADAGKRILVRVTATSQGGAVTASSLSVSRRGLDV